LEEVTFEDIKAAAKKLHGYDVQPPKQELEFESLRVRLSKGQFALYGRIKVDGATFDAKILISGHGIFISGSAREWKVPDSDLVIKEATLDLSISWQSTPIPGKEGEPGSAAEGGTEGTETPPEATDDAAKEDVKKPTITLKNVPSGANSSAVEEARPNESLAAVPAKHAATDTAETEMPASVEKTTKKERSWTVGLKVYGMIVLPYGPKESSALDADYKFKFAVTFSAAWSIKGGF
jgi:hypothetical protein